MADKHPLNYLSPRDADYALEWEELDEPHALRTKDHLEPEDRVALGLSPHPVDDADLVQAVPIQGAEALLRAALLHPRTPKRTRP